MHTYTLKIQDGEGYEAIIAISGNINLHGLAEHIIDTIGFDLDHAFGFYDNLRNPHKSSEAYTLFADMEEADDDGSLSVNRTHIEEVFEKGKKMIFLFDYGDDWQFLLTCKDVEPVTSKRKVRKVLSQKGTPPEQYPDWEE